MKKSRPKQLRQIPVGHFGHRAPRPGEVAVFNTKGEFVRWEKKTDTEKAVEKE